MTHTPALLWRQTKLLTSSATKHSQLRRDGDGIHLLTQRACIVSLSAFIFAVALSVFTSLSLSAQELKEEDSKEKILADQMRLAEQYDLLEKKLFSLYQYEQDQNPERSGLLQRAYQQSLEKLTLKQIDSAVQLLQQARFRDAEKNQGLTSQHLEELLALLQSEDRSKRVRSEIELYKEYAREVNRILRIQQGIRGQAENGDQSNRLKESQQQNAGRTEKLDQNIEDNEGKPEGSENDGSENKPGSDPTKNSDSNPDDSPGDAGNPPPGGNPQEGQSGKPGDPQSSQPENPVQQKLKKAAAKMREATENLDEAKSEQSVEQMREAERELEQAKRELEKILRQLREEEIERTLGSLESRFRRMLELQMKIYDDTLRLDEGRGKSVNNDVEIQSGKLAVRQKGLVAEVDRALLVLEDEGSSVAISETLLQTRQDIQQVADRLSAARTGATTQEIEQGIIETLGFLVEIFAEAQQQDSDPGQPQPGESSQQEPGDEALLNKLAELKLIRGLQKQILTRHTRYSKLLDDPADVVGYANDPGIREALERLSQRQRKLRQITSDIVVGKNR